MFFLRLSNKFKHWLGREATNIGRNVGKTSESEFQLNAQMVYLPVVEMLAIVWFAML